MRVMIWGDMEGVACIQTWEQVTGGTPLFQDGRRLFTGEMNAAVRGAARAGATDIISVDCHGAGNGWSFQSLVAEDLDSAAQWVLGHPWARYITPLEQGVDAVLFVGAHARAGTANGVLSHTVSSEAWYNAFINDVPVGESGILAAICGHWDAPVAFVSGDVSTCSEVQELLGDGVTTAAVKEGLGRFSARSMAPSAACQLIEEQVFRSLSEHRFARPYRPQAPVVFRVELASIDQVNVFRGRTGVEITGDRSVESRGETMWQAWDQFWYRS